MRKLVIACVAVALVGAACSTDTSETADETTSTIADGAASVTTTAAPSDTTASSEQTTTTVVAPPTSAASEPSIDRCVVGTWELDSQKFFEDVLATMPPDEMIGEFEHVGGAYLLTVGADGTFESRRADWAFAVTSDLGDFELTINSSQSGTYELDGDVLSTTTESGEALEVEIKVDGVPFEFPGGGSPIEPPEAEFAGAIVSCNGDSLTATAEGFSSTWSRIG